MDDNTLNIISAFSNLFIAISSALALIFGFIYFNKKLKIYSFKDGNCIRIVAFDKGNGKCKIDKYFLIINKVKNPLLNASGEKNNLIINLEPYPKNSNISIIIFDNFGRRYVVKSKLRKVMKNAKLK